MCLKKRPSEAFLYIGPGRLISPTSDLGGRAKWRKSASHHVEEVKTTQAAREGRSSEPGRPPKVPGDGPVGEKSVFRGHRQKWFLSFEMTSQELRKNSGILLDGPWTIPEILVWGQNRLRKVTGTTCFEFSHTPGAVRKTVWILFELPVCLHGAGAGWTHRYPRRCV